MVSAEFSYNKVRNSTVSKHKVLQSDFGLINDLKVGSQAMCRYTSDPVERDIEIQPVWILVSVDLSLQEGQVSTLGDDPDTEFQIQDGTWVETDTSSLLLKLDSQVSGFEGKTVHGPDLLSDSGDNSDTNFSSVSECHKSSQDLEPDP